MTFEQRVELAEIMRSSPSSPDVETAHERFLSYAAQRPAWMAQAACRGVGPDVFYIERGGDTRPAKAMCEQCPVIGECRDYALEDPTNMFGIWAGQSVSRLRKSTYGTAA